LPFTPGATHNDSSRPLTPWVYAIARYKLVDHFRAGKTSMRDVPLEAAEDIMVHDDHSAIESRHDLQKLMARLPTKTRRAIQYVKLDELSVADAAARSGMSESAVKIAVHRGLKRLGDLMRREAHGED